MQYSFGVFHDVPRS